MKDANTMTTPKMEARGVVPGVAHLALDVVDRSQSTAIALLQDARGELRALVESGIELAEKTSASLFRFARKATQRVDDGVAETLGNVERVIGGAVKTARETTKLASDTASTAVGGLTGGTAAVA
ncbi:MAG TPA: hypothetical protein VGF94_14280 [Kofleriaceae bacterium]|jgi:hypothetical protein